MSQNQKYENTRGPMLGGRGPGGGHGMNVVEKPKSFKGTMGKLIRYCRNDLPMIVIALSPAFSRIFFR